MACRLDPEGYDLQDPETQRMDLAMAELEKLSQGHRIVMACSQPGNYKLAVALVKVFEPYMDAIPMRDDELHPDLLRNKSR